ncbi:MAG TPA: DUF3443 family protein, partial [Polyangiaceae bacterium]|nr:DUF3443 family protein [Polyangiaceae bacterium]
MTILHRLLLLAALPLLAFGCGGGSSHGSPGGDGGAGDDAGAATDGEPSGDADTDGGADDNVAPLVVDEGPPGADSVDVPFVSVTLCIPGTTTCQTIDHVSVDTGSSGLRIIASVLESDIVLPQQTATTGSSLAECFQF